MTSRRSWRRSMPARAMLLAGTGDHDLTQLEEYLAIGGYDQVPKARAMTPDALIAELQAATLRGRGGAGFPMGRKASLIDRASPKPKYLVVNADESEPGAFKDRQVMAEVPHRLLEGCLIAAHAIESRDVFIYIRGEYLTEYEILQRAVDEARAAGLFGDVEITVYRGAGAYICGEETALLDYDSLGALGTFFGAASLIVVDDRCCLVQLALRSTKFYMHESCGKCTPCREGTRWMVQLLERIEAGQAEHSDVDLLRSVGER